MRATTPVRACAIALLEYATIISGAWAQPAARTLSTENQATTVAPDRLTSPPARASREVRRKRATDKSIIIVSGRERGARKVAGRRPGSAAMLNPQPLPPKQVPPKPLPPIERR
jgi:hypothetical protein